MIRPHAFNSTWWGSPAGIVDDEAFFALPEHARAEALAVYDWVEFRSSLCTAPPLNTLAAAGFFLADVQLGFRIALKPGIATACAENLEVRFANDPGFLFDPAALAPFAHERFLHLPGCTQGRLNSRYAAWASQLIESHPETCMALLADGEVQGWFLSRPEDGGLNLALAMGRGNARVSGFLLYEKSLSAYAAAGHRIGFASFSATNTAVHNIYAKLGARFTAPTGIWLYFPEKPGSA